MKTVFSIVLCLLIGDQSEVSGREIFMKTRFEWQYVEEVGMEAEIPIFDDKVKSLDGKEITLTGYYLPISVNTKNIILSKLPYASCFFCGGGGGLESVAEIQFDTHPPVLKLDQLVTIKGRLKLNARELGHMVFILTDPTIISK